MNLLGVALPEYPNKLQAKLALFRTRIALVCKQNEALVALPPMTDVNKIAAMNILTSVSTASYITNPQLFFILTAKQINLSLTYGNNLNSPYAYVQYSLILISVAKNIRSVYKMGQAALSLINKLNVVELAPKTQFLFYAYLNHW